MACCLTAPSHYLNQYCPIINAVVWLYLRVILQEMCKIVILDISSKIINSRLKPHLPGADELNIYWCKYSFTSYRVKMLQIIWHLKVLLSRGNYLELQIKLKWKSLYFDSTKSTILSVPVGRGGLSYTQIQAVHVNYSSPCFLGVATATHDLRQDWVSGLSSTNHRYVLHGRAIWVGGCRVPLPAHQAAFLREILRADMVLSGETTQ